MRKQLFCASVAVACLGMFAACGGDPSTGEPSGNTNGLTLVDADDNHASGEFMENGTRVQFETMRTGEGVSVEIRDADNQLLFSAARTGDRIVTSYFDGQVTLSGPALLLNAKQSMLPEDVIAWAQQAQLSGDSAALERVKDVPELAILDDLTKELDEAGVFSEFLGAGQLPSGIIEKSADVEAAGCGFFKAIGCTAIISFCGASCTGVTGGVAVAACIVGCLVSAGSAGCADCL